MTNNTDDAVEQFIEQLGLVAQADGLPRISGRIMGLMVIYSGPFSFSDLASRLSVSRGSISTNTRLLEGIGVIERVTKPGKRQDYFRIRENPYTDLVKGMQMRLENACKIVDTAKQSLPGEWVEAQERLDELGGFYKGLIKSTQPMIKDQNHK